MRYVMGMTQENEKHFAKRRRVSKQDWLNAALSLLKSGGIEAVRVERLAAQLQVAKSGFYYHFRDRSDLHTALLQHWLKLDHLPIDELETQKQKSPVERLHALSEIVDRHDLSRYDFAIRQWGRQDQKVRRAWRKEMNKRTALVRNLFAELGFEGDDLEMRTRLFTAYQVSERDLFSDLSAKDRALLRRLRLGLLTD